MGKENLMSASWPSPQSLLWSDTKLSNMLEAGPFQNAVVIDTLLFYFSETELTISSNLVCAGNCMLHMIYFQMKTIVN